MAHDEPSDDPTKNAIIKLVLPTAASANANVNSSEASAGPFKVTSQKVVIDVDFEGEAIHGAAFINIEAVNSPIESTLNSLSFHVGFLDIRHIVINGITITSFNDSRTHLSQWSNDVMDKIQGDSHSSPPAPHNYPTIIKENLKKMTRDGPLSFNFNDPPFVESLKRKLDKDAENSSSKHCISIEIHYSLFCKRYCGFGSPGVFFYASRKDECPCEYMVAGSGSLTRPTDIFFPIFSKSSNKKIPHWSMVVSVPAKETSSYKNLDVVTVGKLVKKGHDSLNEKTLFFYEEDNVLLSGITLCVGGFDKIQDDSSITVPTCVYYPPNKKPSTIKKTLEHLSKSIEFFSWSLQMDFPFSCLRIVFMDGLSRLFYVSSGVLIVR